MSLIVRSDFTSALPIACPQSKPEEPVSQVIQNQASTEHLSALQKVYTYAKKYLDIQNKKIEPSLDEIVKIHQLALERFSQIGPKDSQIVPKEIFGRELVILSGHIYLVIARLDKGMDKKAEVVLDLKSRELRVLLTSLNQNTAGKTFPAVSEILQEGQLLMDPRLQNNPNIVRCEHAEILNGRAYLVEEWCAGGEFFNLIQSEFKKNQRVTFDDATRLKFARDMASALKLLHSLKIVHRDIKPENWLIRVDEKGCPTLALCDFTFSFFEDQIKEIARGKEVPGAIKITGGTWHYLSPELFKALNETEEYFSLFTRETALQMQIIECAKESSTALDVFAEASIFFLLFSNYGQSPPWFNCQGRETTAKVVVGKQPDWVINKGKFSPALPGIAPLIARMYDQDPAKRPTMDQVDRELETLQNALINQG